MKGSNKPSSPRRNMQSSDSKRRGAVAAFLFAVVFCTVTSYGEYSQYQESLEFFRFGKLTVATIVDRQVVPNGKVKYCSIAGFRKTKLADTF